jgi:hypothetical protein
MDQTRNNRIHVRQYRRQKQTFLMKPSSKLALRLSLLSQIMMIMIHISTVTVSVMFVFVASTILVRPEYCNAFTFSPKIQQIQLRQRLSFLQSTKQSIEVVHQLDTRDVPTDDQAWIIQGIETQQEKQSTSINSDFLNRQGVIGPNKVLIYDTTLRGTLPILSMAIAF